MVNTQRLLDEGLFTASYKFALLLALADLSIEQGDDSGAPLDVTTEAIAEKFVIYYWRQAMPYPAASEAAILQQNTDRQAAIINLVRDARKAYDSLPAAMRDAAGWRRLVRKVAGVVRLMPLWRLQRIGKEHVTFLYEHQGDGRIIRLRPGVAYCLRKFHALVSDLVQGAWARYVRQQNLNVLGEAADLNDFLFGSDRNSLAQVRSVLMDLQRGRCFYCRRAVAASAAHVDHFVAWARYPIDLGHNFVLADVRCNNNKRDRLPACDHLAVWTERNARFGEQIAAELEEHGFISELAVSNRVAQWAYGQTEAAGGLTWLRADEMVKLPSSWRNYLSVNP
jgi:5-methylcytosine-specific restriction endonuclease McrA